MRLNDITVEVRDKDLARLGQIRPEELDIEVNDLHNNVGTWRLRLPVEHPLTDSLRQPGSGIIVTGPDDVLLSGPTIKNEIAATATDPGGTVTFEGVDDTVLLGDVLAFPDPTNPDPETQTLSHDVRTGVVETLMHQFVNANLGPGAPAARRSAALTAKVVLGVNGMRGPTVTKSARFPVLGNLLAELAVSANLGFRIVQRGSNLTFETYEVVDRSAEVRLDVQGNTLAGYRTAISTPGATQVIVAGQGELTDRQFIHINSAESLAAEAQWGRRIERFVDQRQTDEVAELTQAGLDVLSEEGFTAFSVQAVPMETSAAPFGVAWGLGDRVAIIVDGQELYSTVTGYVMKADREGFRIGATIGDPEGFDAEAAMGRRVKGVERRVSSLERNAEASSIPPDLTLEALTLTRTTDADAGAGNAPALRIGSLTGTHLRIDGNEIVPMLSDTSPGGLFVGESGGAGLTVTGDVLRVRNTNTSPTKSVRFRTSGGSTDIDAGGAALYINTDTSADFTGTRTTKMIVQTGTSPVSFPLGAQSSIAASAANDLTRKTDVDTLIAEAPRGVIAFGRRSAAKSGITSEVGVVRLNTTLLANRAYLVTTGYIHQASTVNEVMMTGLRMLWTTDGSNATTSSAQFVAYQGDTQSGTGGGPGFLERVYHVGGSNLTVSFLVTARRIAGSGTLTVSGPELGPEIHVIDIGPAKTNTGVDI